MAEASAYPLTWPSGRPRTRANMRASALFRSKRYAEGGPRSKPVTLPDARGRLSEQLEKLGGRYVVLSTNLELRLDGQPRAGQSKPDDPGVALYFQLFGRPIVLACDKWDTVAGNMAAIASHIDALRGQERWGVGSVEQAFAGFAALPAPISPEDWRAILGDHATLDAAEAAYRERIRTAHPDAGGTHARAAALNAAIVAARSSLGSARDG